MTGQTQPITPAADTTEIIPAVTATPADRDQARAALAAEAAAAVKAAAESIDSDLARFDQDNAVLLTAADAQFAVTRQDWDGNHATARQRENALLDEGRSIITAMCSQYKTRRAA
jgi:hypothetical protein